MFQTLKVKGWNDISQSTNFFHHIGLGSVAIVTSNLFYDTLMITEHMTMKKDQVARPAPLSNILCDEHLISQHRVVSSAREGGEYTTSEYNTGLRILIANIIKELCLNCTFIFWSVELVPYPSQLLS